MHIATGAIYHRTNTFSKRLTTLSDFSVNDQWDDPSGVDPTFDQVITQAASRGVTHLPLIYASAVPSGLITADVVGQLIEKLSAPLLANRTSLDGVVLRLSGTLVAEDHEDAETYILSELRRTAGADLPIIAVVDGIANVSREMSQLATVMIAEPDQSVPCASRELDVLARLIASSERRATSWRSVPLICALPLQNRELGPLPELADMVNRMRRDEEVLSIAIATGFPYADTPRTSASVVVSTHGSQPLADSLADELARAIWHDRAKFLLSAQNLEEAVHTAMQATAAPTTLIELGDDLSGGAPGDGTALLWALLDLGAADAALAPFVDASAFQIAQAAGAGAKLELTLGGRADTRHGYPIPVTAQVLQKPSAGQATSSSNNERDSDDEFVVVRVYGRHGGAVDVVLTERPPRKPVPQLLQHAGIKPGSKRILVLKSSVGLGQLVGPDSSIIFVLTPGTTTADFAFFDYERLPRPIYPLDDDRAEPL